MQRARAGAIGALVLVVLNLIFDLMTFPTFAAYGFRNLNILNPLYYFVTTTIISFAIGLAFALLYMMLRGHIPYKGISKGVVFGIMVWTMTECIKAAQLIAYTTIPVLFSIIWLFQGLISYVIYGIVLSFTLEPHAHGWLHPELLDHLGGKRRVGLRATAKTKKAPKRTRPKKAKKKTVKRKTKKKSTRRKTKRKSRTRKVRAKSKKKSKRRRR